jgi:hypothetical protein
LLWLFKRGRFVLPALVLGFDLAWCQVPSATATTVLARAQSFGEVLRQPVDELLCPLGLGCRYIAVPRQTMVAKVWDTGAFLELRAGAALDATRRAAFDPLILRNRRLRFADLSGSQFFNVDLTGAELQGARLDWMEVVHPEPERVRAALAVVNCSTVPVTSGKPPLVTVGVACARGIVVISDQLR